MGTVDIEAVLAGLCSTQRLQRERHLLQVKTADQGQKSELVLAALERLKSEEISWEAASGLLSASVHLLPEFSAEQFEETYKLAISYLDHGESRVRKSSGDLLANTVSRCPKFFDPAFNVIIDLIKRDLARDPTAAELPENEKVRQKIIDGQKTRGGMTSKDIFHESAGWRHLETSMNALRQLFEALPATGSVDKKLFELLKECTCHSNRFIREAAFYIASAILNPAVEGGLVADFGELILRGISDNWSQVRMASSNTARSFLFSLSEMEREKFYETLLPPICINRYYIAAGVRIHNQETWRQLFPTGGVEIVEKYLSSFSSFYRSQIAADNHAVREAACACIAELASKCSENSLEPHWCPLLDSLIDCFGDDSWPVRDATCIAAGNFVKSIPVRTRPKHPVLYEKFMENCTDPIASVRQGGAVALAALVSANEEYFEKVISSMNENFENLKDQPQTTSKFGRLEPGPGQFGVVRRVQQGEDEMENGTMYSCGSLAPKMKAKQPLGTGCSACTKFTRDEEPWERADGAIVLLAEMTKIKGTPENTQILGSVLDKMGDALKRHKQFEAHHQLHETACKQIVHIAKGLGKRELKNHLVGLFDIIFYAIDSPVLLTKAAGEESISHLAKILGENILKGRIEMTHSENLDSFLRAMKNPIRVPIHQVSGMKTAEDNYGAFIGMTPGQPY